MSSYDPIPLLQMGSSTVDPLPRRRRPKTSSSSTFVRFFQLLLLLHVFSLSIFHLTTNVRPFYKSIIEAANPHSPQRLSDQSLPESEIVRSLFGKTKDGGIEGFDLVASIYYQNRGGVGPSASNMTLISTQGDSRDHQRPDVSWERVFSEVVMKNLAFSTLSRNVVVNATLPARIVSEIQQNSRQLSVQLQTSFHLVPSLSLPPSPSDLVPINTTHFLHNLIPPYGRTHPKQLASSYPLPYPALGRSLVAQQNETLSWENRLGGSTPQGILQTLPKPGQQRTSPKPEPEKDEDVMEDDGSTEREKGKAGSNELGRYAIITRSTVTMVRDFPTYSLSIFRTKMNVLKNRKAGCMRVTTDHSVCTRSFPRLRHFETLLEMGTKEDLAASEEPSSSSSSQEQNQNEVVQREPKGWRYAPFVQTGYGRVGASDMVEIPPRSSASEGSDEVDDLTFSWHISFASNTPLKLALSSKYLQDGRNSRRLRFSSLVPGPVEAHLFDVANAHDRAEFHNALEFHPLNPHSRPILRFALRQIARFLSTISAPLTLLFWFTRTTTTGISMAAYSIDTIFYFASFFIELAFKKDRGEFEDFAMTPVVVVASSMVWSLAARVEWVWSGCGGWVPVGLRRRKASHAERASERLDRKFGWTARSLATLLIFTLYHNLLPLLPSIISSSPPPSPYISPASLAYHHIPNSTSLLRFIKPIYQTSHLMLFLAQGLLNYRSKTFGGGFRIVAYLLFASSVLKALPVVLSGWWGRWELMENWRLEDLMEMWTKGVLGWQAWRFGRVKQEEEVEQ